MQANGGVLPPKASGGETVANVLARFWIWAESNYDPRGRELENYKLSLNPMLRLYGDSPAASFDAECLTAVQAAMASGSWRTPEEKAILLSKKRKSDWCRNVVNRRIVRIKTCWKWCEAHKLVPAGSYHHLQTVRGLGKKSRNVRHTAKRLPSTREQVDAVLPFLSRNVAVMLEVQFLAGMRSCEVRIMRTIDIDRSGDVWLYTPATHKNDWREEDQPRVVPLGPECQRLLSPLLRPDDPEHYLFPSHPRKNSCYTACSFPQAVRRAAAKAGVKLCPYQGRHAAKVRIARTAGVEAARTVLGHHSIETTALYGGMDVDLAKETMRKLG
jgi:integrase